MKHIFIILSFISIGINSLYAQSNNRYDWGIEGGPNLSTFRFSGTPERKPIIFGSGGFIFQYNLKKYFRLKPDFPSKEKDIRFTIFLMSMMVEIIWESGKVFLLMITSPCLFW